MTVAPILTTDRLILRPIALEDWEPYAAAWADPAMVAFIGGIPRDRTTSWAKLLSAAGLWSLCGFGYWTFACRETGVWLGNGGLGRFERGLKELEGVPEAGWALAPAAWGKGLATEAMAAALDWADRTLDVPEVRCIIDTDNVASRAVARKIGFTQCASTQDAIGPVDVFRKAFARAIS
jgi:RimJ/RimL family protein N-acetyltransferase